MQTQVTCTEFYDIFNVGVDFYEAYMCTILLAFYFLVHPSIDRSSHPAFDPSFFLFPFSLYYPNFLSPFCPSAINQFSPSFFLLFVSHSFTTSNLLLIPLEKRANIGTRVRTRTRMALEASHSVFVCGEEN